MYSCMKTTMIIQGRKTNEEEIQFVQQFIQQRPDLHRTALSKELAEVWDWRDRSGRLKDMACRAFMLKLHKQGRIVLPPLRRSAPKRKKSFVEVPHSIAPITCSLDEILPLQIKVVSPGDKFSQLFRSFLTAYHYLDYRGPVGKNIGYLIYDKRNRPLACLLFGAAAWQTAPRDQFIGWSHEIRKLNLELVINNHRFLILPWVKVPNLASYLLGAISKQIGKDWLLKYNHPIYLLETFVQKDRFKGTCYQASNWKHVGETKGRTRNGQHNDLKAPIKSIYVYPLHRRFRQRLLLTRST